MTIELVTYADLKSYLSLTQSLITSYPDLNVIRDSVYQSIESYIGRELEKIERTESIFINESTNMISLKGLPVSSVATLSYVSAGTTYTLTSSDYIITNYGLYSYNSLEQAMVSCKYTGGYEQLTLPAKIERAALIQTAYEFQTRAQIGAETVSTEGGTVTRKGLVLINEVKRLLDEFKHPLRWL